MSAVASTTSLWPHKLYILVFTTSVCVLYVSTVKSYALSDRDRTIVRSFDLARPCACAKTAALITEDFETQKELMVLCQSTY